VTEPYRAFATEEDYQRHLEHVLGERLAKLQRALRRAESERDELRQEVEELRRQLHTGGTPLR
jgi:predicted RNase H-like nuclease (RuvC/YqgF family)